jgi:ketosteroid isomerase-like protein
MTAVERIHALWSAFRSGGVPAALAHVDEECEWIPGPELPRARALRGAAEVRAYLERLADDGVRLEPSLHTCEEVGDGAVLVGGRMRVVSRASLSDSPLFWLYRLHGGRVVRVESYACRRDALAAAGALARAA